MIQKSEEKLETSKKSYALNSEDESLDKSQLVSDVKAPHPFFFEDVYLDKIKSFPDHPFKLYDKKRLDDLAESIKENGIIEPIVLTKRDGDYIILSGHNRKRAAWLAGIKSANCKILKDISYDDAKRILIESNLNQRSFSDMLISERCYSLKLLNEAISSQGKRSDLFKISDPKKAREEIAENYALSPVNVSRYLKLSSIDPSLMTLLDDKKLGFIAGYNLAKIEDRSIQRDISSLIKNAGFKISVSLSEKMYEDWSKGEFDLNSYLEDKKTKRKAEEKIVFKLRDLNDKELEDSFLRLPKSERTSIIKTALIRYFKALSLDDEGFRKENLMLSKGEVQNDEDLEEKLVDGVLKINYGGRWIEKEKYEMNKEMIAMARKNR